jgi:hypothetical protein
VVVQQHPDRDARVHLLELSRVRAASGRSGAAFLAAPPCFSDHVEVGSVR